MTNLLTLDDWVHQTHNDATRISTKFFIGQKNLMIELINKSAYIFNIK
jgi:hypothetical protein